VGDGIAGRIALLDQNADTSQMPQPGDSALQPDEVQLRTRLARWLSWWCMPRWRALLTWVALATLMAEVLNRFWNFEGAYDRYAISQVLQRPIAFIGERWPNLLPTYSAGFLLAVNYGLFLSWFEPLVLRLNLARAAAWLALRIAPTLLWEAYMDFIGPLTWGRAIVYVLHVIPAAATVLVLRGWRTRPWVAFIALAIPWAGGVDQVARMTLSLSIPYWFWSVVMEIPAPAMLLFGTRLLRPAERVQSSK
jgi:hypothetical protein